MNEKIGVISREDAFKRAEKLKRINEAIYTVKFEIEQKFLPIDVLIPTQRELNEAKLIVVLQEIKHGYDAPVIVLSHKGRYYILDGHHRAFALKKLGYSQIEVLVLKPEKEIETKIEQTVKKSGLKTLEDVVVVRS